MEGEEFTGRLLTPFEEQKLTMLLRQGYDVDALLRLMAGEVRLEKEHKRSVYYNRPSDRDGYPVFRRVIAHLSSIQDRHALYIEPLLFQHSWTLPASAVTPEGFQSIYKDFSLTYDAEKQVYQVSKLVTGRIIITNYDPAILSNEERLRLHEEAEEGPFNEIIVDIRPGYPGGEYPLHGKVRLRSFYNVLTSLGRDIEEEPEYDVPPDPRTPQISENPVHTLEILETDSLPLRSRSFCGSEWLPLRGSARNWLSVESQSVQPPLSTVSDDCGSSISSWTGHYHLEIARVGRIRAVRRISASVCRWGRPLSRGEKTSGKSPYAPISTAVTRAVLSTLLALPSLCYLMADRGKEAA